MSAETPAVTVIVPTYNSRATLRCALRSVLAQEFGDFEVWIIGDACTDGSEEEVAKLSDARLRWFNLPENTGNQWRPNNEGVQRARGRYIAHLGHDDLWLPWHLSALVAHAEKSGADFVHDLLVNVGPHGVLDVNGPPPPGITYERYFAPPSCWLYRREVADKVGLWKSSTELSWGIDYDYLRRIYLAGMRIEFVSSLGVVKFPSPRWRAYSSSAPKPQVASLEEILKDPRAFAEKIMIESAVSFSQFTDQGAKEPLRVAMNRAVNAGARALKVFVRAAIDLYGRERWPLRPLLIRRMQNIRNRSRKPRGLSNRVTKLLFSVALGLVFGYSSAIAAQQEFRFNRPNAQSVDLMCECNDWKAQPMTKHDDGTWALSVPLSPGTYGYKFLVDQKEWVFDPQNPVRKNVNGVENSLIEIAGDNGPQSTPVSIAPSPSPSEKPAPSGPGPAITQSLGALSPTPGETLTVEVPLSDQRRAAAVKDGNAKLVHARVAIAVPQNFDPQKSWPILVISNTESYSNIDAMQQFKQTALDEGWVILAADDAEAESKKEGATRGPTIGAAFDYIIAAWPGVKDWPVACGGHSGGAKNSGFLAADLVREHHRVIGMLMMGCNQDMATVAYRKSATPATFLSAAVFLSSGKSDTIATPSQHDWVKASLKSSGFLKVRLESFDGAHVVYQAHVSEALRWFVAESPKVTPTKQESDFDKFFKKKQ